MPESEASENISAIVIDIELIFHRKANALHIPTKLADCGVRDIFSFMHTTPETQRSKFKKANLAEAEKVKRSHTKGQKYCPSVDFREQLKDSLEANFVVEQVEENEDFRMILKPPTFNDTQSQKIVAAPYLAKGFLLPLIGRLCRQTRDEFLQDLNMIPYRRFLNSDLLCVDIRHAPIDGLQPYASAMKLYVATETNFLLSIVNEEPFFMLNPLHGSRLQPGNASLTFGWDPHVFDLALLPQAAEDWEVTAANHSISTI